MLLSNTNLKYWLLALAVMIGLMANPLAQAFATNINPGDMIVSGDNTETCARPTPLAPTTPSCNLMTVNPHPAWATSPNSQWISYDPTGYTEPVFVPNGGQNFYLSVFETLVSNQPLDVNLNVWADDTAGVYLNGVQLYAPNFTQNICANGPIGCQPEENGNIQVTLAKGTNVFQFDVYQSGGNTDTILNPTGLRYEGPVDAVPAPAGLLLMGSALAGVGYLAKRKAANKTT